MRRWTLLPAAALVLLLAACGERSDSLVGPEEGPRLSTGQPVIGGNSAYTGQPVIGGNAVGGDPVIGGNAIGGDPVIGGN